jgi:hypothetical protein
LGVVLLLAAWSVLDGWLDWPGIGRWLRTHSITTALAGAGIALLVVATLELRRHRRRDSGRAPLSWWAIAGGAVLFIAAAWGATAWLLHEAASAQDPAAARVDAVKTGLGIGAGAGGVLALLVAVRRQWHQELTALETTHDATERRVTELYTKAVEQLGSDKAPVRLGGLYALERLAQDNPTQRQTIVNVWCAYLRMPYIPPGDPPTDDEPPTREHLDDVSAETRRQQALQDLRERVQEREVRLTAQRLLADHLRDRNKAAATFWTGLDIDLTGATLVNIDLSECTMRSGTFASTTFTGNTNFKSATFTDASNFVAATFTGAANFVQASFDSHVSFERTTFTGAADFMATTFAGSANFRAATFIRYAHFAVVDFPRHTNFAGVTFADGMPEEVKRLWSRR